MRPADVILAKRSGQSHPRDVLSEFLNGYLNGSVADYQVAAWLMAVCFQGMSARETADLTEIMAKSGDVLDLSSLPYTVDKHSTGGVGDKTSLVLAPLLAEAGATVAKMSGRGLGHTGGTVDKLESIPGFRSELSDEEFLSQAAAIGVVVSGQSKEMAPLDGLLYSLRDATGTVESLPLIASSIMSKKLAGGAGAIVLDVKVGKGAFLRTLEDARKLARMMISIGEHAGRNVRAVLTGMEQPLGYAVGNSLEVREAIGCLRGQGPADLTELCLTLAEQVVTAAGLQRSRQELAGLLEDGRAYDRFVSWIEAQGGDENSLDALELAPGEAEVESPVGGIVSRLDALAIGRAAGLLGGGRSRKGEAIDPGVGVSLHVKVGDRVEAGERVATLHHRGGRGLDEARELVKNAYEVGDAVEPQPLIIEVVGPG
ncbi:MAG TPA: thymidine phosphorylase [Trueperaceae bacterium]